MLKRICFSFTSVTLFVFSLTANAQQNCIVASKWGDPKNSATNWVKFKNNCDECVAFLPVAVHNGGASSDIMGFGLGRPVTGMTLDAGVTSESLTFPLKIGNTRPVAQNQRWCE